MQRILVLISFALVVICSGELSGQSFRITGVYLDKMSNPLEDASVEYLQGVSHLLGQTSTDENGAFDLLIIPEEIWEASGVIPICPQPNPFSSTTAFPIYFGSAGEVSIKDAKGEVINSIEMSEPGEYQVTWGGLDDQGKPLPAGAYEIQVSTNDYQAERTVLYYPEGKATPLEAIYKEKQRINMNQSEARDILRFTRENTTLLEVGIFYPTGYTTLGEVTGNRGPVALSDIEDTLTSIDSGKTWQLNDHFHNDDQSVYTLVGGGNFRLGNDDILHFHADTAGVYSARVIATDPSDPGLKSYLHATLVISE